MLIASDCLMHLEHVYRGCYWMGLSPAGGDTMSIGFSTPGYLKTRVLAHVEPSPEG
jgi:hypothetical protein